MTSLHLSTEYICKDMTISNANINITYTAHVTGGHPLTSYAEFNCLPGFRAAKGSDRLKCSVPIDSSSAFGVWKFVNGSEELECVQKGTRFIGVDFVLRKKGSKMEKRMKEEEIERKAIAGCQLDRV